MKLETPGTFEGSTKVIKRLSSTFELLLSCMSVHGLSAEEEGKPFSKSRGELA